MIPPTCDTGLLADRERWETSARGGHRYIKRTTHSLLTPSSPSQRLKELERSTHNGGFPAQGEAPTSLHGTWGMGCACVQRKRPRAWRSCASFPSSTPSRRARTSALTSRSLLWSSRCGHTTAAAYLSTCIARSRPAMCPRFRHDVIMVTPHPNSPSRRLFAGEVEEPQRDRRRNPLPREVPSSSGALCSALVCTVCTWRAVEARAFQCATLMAVCQALKRIAKNCLCVHCPLVAGGRQSADSCFLFVVT